MPERAHQTTAKEGQPTVVKKINWVMTDVRLRKFSQKLKKKGLDLEEALGGKGKTRILQVRGAKLIPA